MKLKKCLFKIVDESPTENDNVRCLKCRGYDYECGTYQLYYGKHKKEARGKNEQRKET